MSVTYRHYYSDKHRELTASVDTWRRAFSNDPWECLEQAGAHARILDTVAELHVLEAFGRSTSTVEDAIEALDRYAIVQSEAAGAPGRAPEMDVAMNRWIQGWRRRLEKFQREHPGL